MYLHIYIYMYPTHTQRVVTLQSKDADAEGLMHCSRGHTDHGRGLGFADVKVFSPKYSTSQHVFPADSFAQAPKLPTLYAR